VHTCAVACLHASVCAHRGCSWTVCAIGTWHGPGRGTNAWCCPLDSSQRASPPLQCVRARATGPLCGALRSERPWALVRLNAPTSPYHSIGCGRDAPMRRTPDAELCTPTNTCVWSEPARGGAEAAEDACKRDAATTPAAAPLCMPGPRPQRISGDIPDISGSMQPARPNSQEDPRTSTLAPFVRPESLERGQWRAACTSALLLERERR
jgi:hypothetical protein